MQPRVSPGAALRSGEWVGCAGWVIENRVAGTRGAAAEAGQAAAGRRHSLPEGILLIVSAFLFSALTGFAGKFVHGSVAVTVFVQYLVSSLVFVPMVARHGLVGLKSDHAGMLVVRSLVGSGAQLLFFASLAGLPLLDASLLSNSAPLFIPLIVWVWLRKPVQGVVWVSLAVGLVGVVLVIHPGPQMFRDPASLVALGSGVLSAISLTVTNRLAETEPPYRVLFYNFGISAVGLLPVAVWMWRPIAGRQMLLLVGIGVLFALTQYFIILAYRYASATELSPFNYSVVVFAGLLGWVFLGNVPGVGALVGTALICAGGIVSIEGGHKEGLGHPLGSGHWWRHWRRPWFWRRSGGA